MSGRKTIRSKARPLTPREHLSELLKGATELDAEAATQFALGVLDAVQIVCACLIAAGMIEPASLRADLRRQLKLRRGDCARALAAAILLDGLASARPRLRGDRGREAP